MRRILILGIIISLVLVGCTSSSKGEGQIFSGQLGSIDKKSSSDEKQDEKDLDTSDDSIYKDTYVVMSIIDDEQRFVLKSLTTNRQFRFAYGMGTSFLDKWGNPTSQTDFVRGSIVTIGQPTDNVISSMQMYKEAWVVDDLSNFSYDVDKEEFKIGNTKYRIRPTASIFSDDLVMTLSDVTKDDRLRVVGIDQEVISVTVTTGHGYIALQNTAFFAGSLITIGTRIHAMLATDTVMSVPAGTYMVTVAKDGYGGSKEITVEKNQTVTIDLDTLKGEGPKTCEITFHVPIEDSHVYVDNKEVNKEEKVSVTYGQHTLKVEAKGYDVWEKTLVVNSPNAEITIDPTEDLEDESSSASSSVTSASASSGSTSSSTSESTSSTSSSAAESSSSSSTSKTQAELDYLTTLSNMLSQLTQSQE